MKYTYRRGFLWISIYLLLSLTMLAVAIAGSIPDYRDFWTELAVALGFIGLAMFTLQFLFSGRFKAIAPTFGMDNIIQYHREIGIVAFFFILAHPLILIFHNPDFLNYFNPKVNLMRAVALSFVSVAILMIVATSLWREAFKLDYEKWRLVHGLLGLSIVFIGIVHSIQVSHYLHSFWKKAAIAALGGAGMYLTVHTRVVRPWLSRKYPYRIKEVKEERGDAYTVILEPEGHKRLRFICGQFVWITIGPSPFSLQQHPFSVASSIKDKTISLTAKELGDFTEGWKNLQKGTRAFLEGPFGSFTPVPDKNIFLVMGGIGITPAMSMLRSLRDTNDSREAVLIYGCKNWEDVTFREELEDISKKIKLKIVYLLSEPADDWKGEKGHIDQQFLEKYLPEKPEEFMYFICGPKPLMDITEIALRNTGIDWRTIYTERFEIV
jgi:predicted ferric reductase